MASTDCDHVHGKNDYHDLEDDQEFEDSDDDYDNARAKGVYEDGGFHYKFVGECYLHTMMDGKAMDVQLEHSQKYEAMRKQHQIFDAADEQAEAKIRYQHFELR